MRRIAFPLEPAMSDNGYRCGHAACQCTTAPDGGQYCSDYCRETAGSGHAEPGRCGCGHAACASDPEGDLRQQAE
ncbi:MAG TPA: hypothetical protein VFH59_16595 [Frateuria sp.]|uniref:hypothetical protein n=1 Tax=Frateuria sp. TaxID=2211372 RepID=UPI002D801577|nr:hypothetical protein [Frateuria sp.]HET6807056.1 hypothetical protein [Frateuria sp.]